MQRDGSFGMLLVCNQLPAFQLKARLSLRARAGKVGQERDHGARQRRMLRLVMIDVLRDVLQAAGDVRRFVAGGGEDVVSGDDAADAEEEEASHQYSRMLLEEGFDAGLPRRRRRRRGRRLWCENGPGFAGFGGSLFSGQTCAPVS